MYWERVRLCVMVYGAGSGQGIQKAVSKARGSEPGLQDGTSLTNVLVLIQYG